MKETEPAETVYAGPWHYRGYHDVKSVCYLRLYQPKEPRPAIAIFTELENNPGSSITNRIEVLATTVWEFLQRPTSAPVVIEHYPNRGVYNTHKDRWQFPERLNFVEFSRKLDTSFEKPKWLRMSRLEVEQLIGQPFRK